MSDARPDLLYLVHRLPFPPDKGDRILTYHLLKFLAQRARVHLACLNDEPVPEKDLAELNGLCARLAVVPLGPGRWLHALGAWLRGGSLTEGAFHASALSRVLRDWAARTRFHAVLATSSGMVPYLRCAELRGVPAVVDLIDVDSQKWFDYAAAGRGPRSWLYRREGTRLRRLEQQLPAQVQAVVLVSQAEADLYRQFCAPGTVAVVTNGVDLDYFQARETVEEPSCVFVGALEYRPNVEGVVWFSERVWPAIVRRHPGARLYLVGRRPAPAVRRLARRPGVELIGGVPDVRPYLARSAVAIVPLQIARGLQNKVLEALAMRKAVVASPVALAALGVEPGVHLLSAATASEWVDAIRHLFEDDALRQRLGAAGRKYVEQHHHWDRCLEPFEALLNLARVDCKGSGAVVERLDPGLRGAFQP